MTTIRDWLEAETELSRLLSRSPTGVRREHLLERLYGYANEAVRRAREAGAICPAVAEVSRSLTWLLCPVFVCGHHRSGTTLLQRLLDNHPDVVALPSEGSYFTSFTYVARRERAADTMNRFAAEWVARLVDPNFAPHFRLGLSYREQVPSVEFARRLFGWERVLQSRVAGRFVPLLALAAAYKAMVAPNSIPRIWVEKTPLAEGKVARFRYFERARFIHIVRDPCDTFASLKALHLAHLGISEDETLNVPTASGQAVTANSSFGAGSAGIFRRRNRSAEIPPEERIMLGMAIGGAARSFGYESTMSSVTNRARLRYWLAAIVGVAHHVWHAGRARFH